MCLLPGRILFNKPVLEKALHPFERAGCKLKLSDLGELLNAASLAIMARRVMLGPLDVLDCLGVSEMPSMLDGYGVSPYHLRLFHEAASFSALAKP